MKIKLLICFIILFSVFINANFILESAELKVGEQDGQKFISDGTYKEKVLPGRVIQLDIRICNNYPDDNNNSDIDDIEIEVIIEDIDSGADFKSEIIEKEIIRKGEKCKDYKIDFEDGNYIPTDTEDQRTHLIAINATGNFENNTLVEMQSFQIFVETEKKQNDVALENVKLDDKKMSCNEQNKISYTIKNVGTEDLEDAQVLIYSKALGINQKELFKIDEGDSSASKSSETFKFKISENYWKDGKHKIEIIPRVTESPSKKDNENTIDLIVELDGCQKLLDEKQDKLDEERREAEKEEIRLEKAEEVKKQAEELEKTQQALEKENQELQDKLDEAQNTLKSTTDNELDIDLKQLEAFEKAESKKQIIKYSIIIGFVIVLILLFIILYQIFK